MAKKNKTSIAEIISKLADLEAEIDIMKNNKDDFTDKEIKSLQNKFYRLHKKLDNMPDSKNESLEINEEVLKEAKKRTLNRKIRMNEDKEAVNAIKVQDEELLTELCDNNAFILLGVDSSNENLETLVSILKSNKHIKNENVNLYIIKGSLLNSYFNTNDFKSNLNVIAIKQEDLDKIEILKTTTMYQLSVCTNWLENLVAIYNKEPIEDITQIEEVEENKELCESINILDNLYDDLYMLKPQYIKTNQGYMEIKIDQTAPAPEEYDEGYLPENGGNEEELNQAKETYENGEVICLTTLPDEEIYTYIYREEDLKKILQDLNAEIVDIKDLLK